jgi:hypothetical protein
MWRTENHLIELGDFCCKAEQSEASGNTIIGIPSTPSRSDDDLHRKFYFEVEISKIRGGVFIGNVNFLC